jgi:hypothetical protein
MLCDFAAGRSDNLKDHVKSVHLKEDNYNYKCQLCDVTFSSIPPIIYPSRQCMIIYETINVLNVTMHQLNHLFCLYTSRKCMKKSKTRNVLIVKTQQPYHLVCLDNIKDKTCPHCDYATAISSDLSKHIKSANDNIRDKKCPHCDYAGSRIYSLKKHIRRLHSTN